MGFQGWLLALRMDALSTTFGSWILIASCSGQLIRASCLSSARQLDVLTLVSDPRDLTDAHSSRKPRALRVGNERGVLKNKGRKDEIVISNVDIPVHLERERELGKSRSALGFRFRRDLLVFLSGPYYS